MHQANKWWFFVFLFLFFCFFVFLLSELPDCSADLLFVLFDLMWLIEYKYQNSQHFFNSLNEFRLIEIEYKPRIEVIIIKTLTPSINTRLYHAIAPCTCTRLHQHVITLLCNWLIIIIIIISIDMTFNQQKIPGVHKKVNCNFGFVSINWR